MNAMWSRVKLVTMSNLALALSLSGIALLIIGAALFAFRDKLFANFSFRRADRKGKKGYKPVKTEKAD